MRRRKRCPEKDEEIPGGGGSVEEEVEVPEGENLEERAGR